MLRKLLVIIGIITAQSLCNGVDVAVAKETALDTHTEYSGTMVAFTDSGTNMMEQHPEIQHDSHRILQASNWTKPPWWRLYRIEFHIRHVKKCIHLNPINGESCPLQGNGEWYMCLFGSNQICTPTSGTVPGVEGPFTGAGLGRIHPTTRCTCYQQDLRWSCSDWDPCSENALARQFINRTHIPGLLQDHDDSVDEKQDGATYNFKYDITFVESGVVSLAGAPDLIRNVTCTYEGKESYITVVLHHDIVAESLESLFPLNSILVVNSNIFGGCSLRPVDDQNVTSRMKQDLFQDGYLVIHSVSGTPQGIKIGGTPSSFFAMFETVLMDLVPLNETEVVVKPDTSSRHLANIINKEFPPKVISKPLFTLTTAVTATVKTGSFLVHLDANANNLDFYVEFNVKVLSTDATFDLTLKTGELRHISYTSDYINEKIANIDKKLGKIQMVMDKNLPPLKIGAYFEAPIIATPDFTVATDFKARTEIISFMGAKKFKFYIKGPWNDLKSGTNENDAKVDPKVEVVNEDSGLDAGSFAVLFAPKDNDRAFLDVACYVGIVPKVVVYLEIGSALLTMSSGAVITAVSRDLAFPPHRRGTMDPRQNDAVCTTCHFAEVDFVAQVSPVGFSALFTVQLPGARGNLPIANNHIIVNKPWTRGLFKHCLFPEFGGNGVVCGDPPLPGEPSKQKCCDGLTDVCLNGECIKTRSPTPVPFFLPSTLPTPPPTPLPTPSPTPLSTPSPSPGPNMIST